MLNPFFPGGQGGGQEAPAVVLLPAAVQSSYVGLLYSLDLGPLTAVYNTTDAVTYSIASGVLPFGLTLDPNTGVISGTSVETGLRKVEIEASLPTGESAIQSFVFNEAEPSITFAAVDPQIHVPGTAFTLDLDPLVSVQNSAESPTFSIVSGSLPAGLSLSLDGVISGTPTDFGAFTAVVRASISGGISDDQRVAFNAVSPTIVSNGVSLQNFTVGTEFSFDMATLVTITGTSDAPTFTADVGSLPAGLSMSSMGVISGTPSGYGAYAFTGRATLPSGQWTEVTVALFQLSPANAPEAVISGGTAQTWLESGASGSTTYDAADFTASGVLTVLQSGWVEYILVGGGAGGATVTSTAGGGGGGAGGFRRERIYLQAGTYNVSIGGGGGPSNNGAGTSFNDGAFLTRAIGGGYRGGSTSAAGIGGSAGSSGGGGGSSTAGGAGGTTISPEFGSNGGAGNTNATAASQNGGGGGGFSEGGLDASTGRGHGGGGVKIRLWSTLVFCGGGGGGAGNGGSNNGAGGSSVGGTGGASGANGVAGTANTGSGGGGAGGGSSGTRTGGVGGSGRAIFIVKRITA